MQNCSLLTLVVFLLGCAIGALLNSIYRVSTLARIKEAFEHELGAINLTAGMALFAQRPVGGYPLWETRRWPDPLADGASHPAHSNEAVPELRA